MRERRRRSSRGKHKNKGDKFGLDEPGQLKEQGRAGRVKAASGSRSSGEAGRALCMVKPGDVGGDVGGDGGRIQ